MASTSSRASKRKRSSTKSSTPAVDDGVISIKNVPSNVEFSTVTHDVAVHMGRALSLSVTMTKDNDGGDERSLIDDDDNAVGHIRLIPQAGGKKGGKTIIKCKGFGFLTLKGLDPKTCVDTLNEYSRENPFLSVSKGGSNQSTELFFRYGEEGANAEEEMKSRGQAKKDQVLAEAGVKLLELVKEHGGTMHLKDWPMESRRGVNEYGKRRKIKPSDAAKLAGIEWNGETMMFTSSS